MLTVAAVLLLFLFLLQAMFLPPLLQQTILFLVLEVPMVRLPQLLQVEQVLILITGTLLLCKTLKRPVILLREIILLPLPMPTAALPLLLLQSLSLWLLLLLSLHRQMCFAMEVLLPLQR